MNEAHTWYESRQLGLGDDFLVAVEDAIEDLREHPERYRRVHGDVRRALIRRFPYGVFYLVEAERIVVIAVFHARRDPRVWQDRA